MRSRLIPLSWQWSDTKSLGAVARLQIGHLSTVGAFGGGNCVGSRRGYRPSRASCAGACAACARRESTHDSVGRASGENRILGYDVNSFTA